MVGGELKTRPLTVSEKAEEDGDGASGSNCYKLLGWPRTGEVDDP